MNPSSRRSTLRAALAAALVLVVCALAFWWRLGYLGLIDPDEPFYAESAREMLAARDWVVPHIFQQPQFEKPVLLYWLAMGSMLVFGETEFAARAPAALFATLLVLLTLFFGMRVFGARAGLLAAVVLATCLEIVVSARMVLTDVVLAAFVCASVFSLWLAARSEAHRGRWFLAACAASGLAVLTKGPLGLLIPAFGAVVLSGTGSSPFPRRPSATVLGAVLLAAIAVPWYAVMLHRFGAAYADEFFLHENVERFFRAEHPSNNRIYYYVGVLALGAAPWIPALPVILGRAREGMRRDGAVRYLVLWSLLCLAFFMLAQSKLPTYVLFLFVPLALLAGRTLDELLRDGRAAPWERWAAAVAGLAQVATLLLAPRLGPYAAFTLPLALVAGILLVGLFPLMRRRWAGWIGASALAGLALPLLCLGLAGPAIEPILSARRLSAEIAQTVPETETVLASPVLARGITYYTRRAVAVLSHRPEPFYTPHPLPVVVGPEALARLVGEAGSVACGATSREWSRFARRLPPEDRVFERRFGDKVLARVSRDGPGAGVSVR
ncbi:MAG TPA: glycosyltransferase family 39 protein [Candidatus Eisenbacteria bacterium]|jgi:4-amino-4-deoxy-L-arabinose transferase-like glycosyltransferase